MPRGAADGDGGRRRRGTGARRLLTRLDPTRPRRRTHGHGAPPGGGWRPGREEKKREKRPAAPHSWLVLSILKFSIRTPHEERRVAAMEAAAPDQDQIGSLNPLTNLIAPRHSSPTQKQSPRFSI